jgi:hypothetical protein
MVIKAEMKALEENSITLEETAEFFHKIHSSCESALNVFAVPEKITHSVCKICEYINSNYPECQAMVLEGYNAFIVFEIFKEKSKTIH